MKQETRNYTIDIEKREKRNRNFNRFCSIVGSLFWGFVICMIVLGILYVVGIL